MRFGKISKRITVGYVLLSMFFVLVLLLCMAFLVNVHIGQQERAAMQVRLSNTSKSIDVQINTAQEVTNSLAWDAEIQNLAVTGSENADSTAICRAIQARTDRASAKNMSVYVSALSHSLDRVYGTERAVSAINFLSSTGFGSVSAMEITEYFTKNATDIYFRLMEQSSNAKGNTLVIVERKTLQNKPIYFFTLVDLNQFINEESAGDTIMIMSDNTILACSNYKIAAPMQGVYKLLEKGGSINTLLNGPHIESDYQYLIGKSEVMSWYYVLAQPYSFFSQARVNMYLICLAVIICVILIAIILICFVRRIAYKPIEQTVKAIGKYNHEMRASEGEYICETVNLLAEKNQSLTEELEDFQDREHMEFLRNLLRGIRPDVEEMRMLVQQFCAEKDGPYRVCVLEFSNFAQLQEAFSEEMLYEIRCQIVAFIMQQLGDDMVAKAMIMNYKRFVVVATGIDMRSLRAKLMNVVATVSGSFEAELAGSVGDLCERLEDVADSYASALKILESHYSLGSHNAIVTSEDVVVNRGSSGVYYPIELERELIAEVIRCHETEVAMLLTQILDENFEKYPLTKERLSSFAFSIASTVNRIADTLGKSTEEIFGEGNIVFLDLKMSNDKMDVRSKVYGMFNTLVEFIGSQAPNGERDISELMLDFIHAHYNEDISLSDLSAEFSLSLSYTSTLFKEVTGENFKDYLNRYRIKRACDILREAPSIKNTELAKRVGCNTVATLLRLFNKYEGTTPGQYIKKENAEK